MAAGQHLRSIADLRVALPLHANILTAGAAKRTLPLSVGRCIPASVYSAETPQIMAKPKHVGYIELEWTCPTCGTRSGGTVMVCPTCGAPQPANAHFEAPSQGQVIATDDPAATEVAKAVAAGPDVQCPFCGARNSATADACNQCHAPLKGARARAAGETLGPLPAAAPAEVTCHVCGAKNLGTAHLCAKCGAPLQRRAAASKPGAPAPLPAPQRGGVALWWLWGLGALILLAIVIFAWLGLRSQSYVATVERARWERSVEVLGFVPVEKTAWRTDLPAGVEPLRCRDELYATSDVPTTGAREVCGTPYTVDTGTGYGDVLQDCVYEVYAPRCTFETMQWVIVDTLVESGEGFAPEWPRLAAAPDREAGNRSERYMCDVNVDGALRSFALTADTYALCVPQSRWKVAVNGLGAVVEATPVGAQ